MRSMSADATVGPDTSRSPENSDLSSAKRSATPPRV